MSHGWMGKILEIDLTSKEVSTRGTSTYMPDYIGGRALASRIAWDEIPADIEAFDKENRIIISTGPLTGTLAPTSGRCIMSSLSPRTYPKVWYTHSTIGGWFGAELKYAGYDALIIKGKAESPVFIEIHDEDVQIADADNLWGMDARRTQLELKAKLGAKTQLLAIGPAGENLVRFATVQHAEENAAGHSGFGAVWGSKKLKAIAVRGTKGVSVADPAALLSEIVNAGTAKKTPPIAVTFEGGTMWYREEEGETGVAKDKIAEQDPPDDGYGPVCTQACTFDCILGGEFPAFASGTIGGRAF
jgi:aldehyde:ferredoxin oxidoreductase